MIFIYLFFLHLDKGYFDLQPSWFDTISNNAGCLKIDNLPVLAKDLEAMRNVKSNSKPSTAAAKGMKKETCEIRFLNSLHLCGSWVVWWMTKNLDTKNCQCTLQLKSLAKYSPHFSSMRNSLISQLSLLWNLNKKTSLIMYWHWMKRKKVRRLSLQFALPVK